MARADVLIQSIIGNAHLQAGHQLNPVEVASGTQYAFFISQLDVSLYWTKSTDGGFTWTSPVSVKAGGGLALLAVWYDRWTPGDSGNLIHLAYAEINTDDVFYRSLDTSTDTLGTERTVFAGDSLASGANQCISITKAGGGNLYVLFDGDGGTETGFYRSIDAGVNWTVRSNTAEGADYFILAPGFAADNQDILCIFWDRSASEISRKVYDDDLNSWAETSIAGSMTSIASSTCVPQMALMIDATNSKVILVAWTNRDTLNARLRCWRIDESTITALTDVVSASTDDQQMCSLSRDTGNDDWYCFYGGKTDGTETAGTSINIYYKVSTDDGTSWGSETLLTLSARNFNMLFAPFTFLTDFWTSFRAAHTSLNGLLYNSVLFPTGAAAGGGPIFGGSVVL